MSYSGGKDFGISCLVLFGASKFGFRDFLPLPIQSLMLRYPLT
jgi:hypothetical protein